MNTKNTRDPRDLLYVDKLTEEEDGVDGYGIFGDKSGYCYGSFLSEAEANNALLKNYPPEKLA